MTEDEARTKWCPYARRPSKTNLSDRTCIASACMAWRWRLRPIIDAPTVLPGTGYCGLAGNAQHAP